MLSNSSLLKLNENDTVNSKCKEELTSRLQAINAKINTNNELKGELTLIKNRILKQANDHIRAELSRLSVAKINEIKSELEQLISMFERTLTETNEQGNMLKKKVEEELRNRSEVVSQSPAQSQQQSQPRNQATTNKDDDFFDYDDDALMINESINEFSETFISNDNHKKTESLSAIIESFLQKPQSNIQNTLEYKECPLKIDEINLGYLIDREKNLISPDSFQLDTPLADNLTFEVDRECLIKFSCPNTNESNDDTDKFRACIKIELYDSAQLLVPVVLKERLTSTTRHCFQVYFKPNKTGIFKLVIKYKSTKILNSPVYFVVLPAKTPALTTTTPSEQFDLSDAYAKLKNLHINYSETNSTTSEKPRSKLASLVSDSNPDTFEKTFSSTISVGRGRLLKQKDKAKQQQTIQSVQIPQLSNPFNVMSQKRKSPSYSTDLNNNQVVDIPIDDDSLVLKESSSKLQRANEMDTDQFESVEPNSLDRSVCILSNHLAKHTRINNNRLIEEHMPSLKAQFVQKFSDGLQFPIGVRACVKRNYLIVCNSSAHDVKIFHRTNAQLIHTIKTYETLFTFLRPSALLINGNELFVKDDKEILVFDLDNSFQFLRKFGFKILQRPYGLAFNTADNLVVVDAYMKDPKMHIFNKSTGELIRSSPYEPVIAQHARSPVLNQSFYNNKADLPPLEKTKIRFIDSSRDYVYAADLGRSIIFKTNFDGTIVKAFGTFGKRMSQFCEPSGIHVDYDGKALLIGDSKNNRIQLYDCEGNYKCDIEFMDEKIVRPSDIHVDSEGYLYVSCFIHHCIKKYKLID